jgi:hypothetical protein
MVSVDADFFQAGLELKVLRSSEECLKGSNFLDLETFLPGNCEDIYTFPRIESGQQADTPIQARIAPWGPRF